MKSKKHIERSGRRAEIYAGLFLRLKGYQILERRFKTKVGEIDIIARRKNLLVVVEVKRRTDLQKARESISLKARQRIARAARIYISRHKFAQSLGLRFDLISVHGFGKISHDKDIWRI